MGTEISKGRPGWLESVFDSAPFVMLVVDEAGRIVDINRAGRNLAGKPKEEVLGLLAGHAAECVNSTADGGCGHSPHCPVCPVRSRVEWTARTGEPVFDAEGQFTVVRNGRPVTLDFLVSTAAVTDGGRNLVLVTLTDTSDRKQEERERRILSDILKLVENPNSTGEFLEAVARGVQQWSGCEAAAVCLRDRKENRSGGARMHCGSWPASNPGGNGNPAPACVCAQFLLEGRDGGFPFRTLRGSLWTNARSDLSWNPGAAGNRCIAAGVESIALVPLSAFGENVGLLVFSDSRKDRFDDRKLAPMERLGGDLALVLGQRMSAIELRLSEQRFRNYFELGIVGLVTVDIEGRTIHLNDKMCEIFRYPRAELEAKSWKELTHPDDLEACLRLYERALAGEIDGHTSEIRYIRGDGTVVDTLVSVRYVRDDQGRAKEFVSVILDITEQKRMREQFLQAQRMESIGRLAGGIAHDFNNLLTVINGYSRLALNKLDQRDPLRSDIGEVLAAGERAAALTRQLLSFSRRQAVEPAVISLNTVLGEMERMMPRVVGLDIEMKTVLAPDLGLVRADPNQIHQVILNLAINSRDAMPDGGRLVIATANVSLCGESLDAAAGLPPGEYVELSVADTGHGMDARTLERAFEPFFTTKPEGKGTGLGLSSVYGIVQQNGGHIRMESEAGSGATVRIWFPRVAGEEEEAPGAGQPPQVCARGAETILLVEDQADVRSLAVRILRSNGYTVLEASGGGEALRICADSGRRIDLLLTDVVMPGMNGRAVAESVGQARPGIKILFMSGYTAHALGDHGVEGEAEDVIWKPFSPESLTAGVRRRLGPPRRPVRVLLVDDEEHVRGLLSRILENEGYLVEEAADGDEALRKMRRQTPDVIVTDLVMPNREGLETIQQMRRECPTARIIAMSGAFGGQFLRPAQFMGADATLAKPITPDALTDLVRRLVHEDSPA